MTAGESRAFFAGMVLHTQWGRMWVTTVILALLAWIAFARRTWPLALVFALGLAVTPALAGHALSDSSYPAIGIAADAMHVLAASAWLGTLFVIALTAILPRDSRPHLVLALVTADRADIGGDTCRHRPVRGRDAHRLVVRCLGLDLRPHALCQAHAGRGRGKRNWRTATPRCAEGDEAALRISAHTELALGALVLLVTAILVATDLPKAVPMSD
jgi:putative copper export protein